MRLEPSMRTAQPKSAVAALKTRRVQAISSDKNGIMRILSGLEELQLAVQAAPPLTATRHLCMLAGH